VCHRAVPERNSLKAVAIAKCLVGSGVSTVLAISPRIQRSPRVTKLLTEGIETKMSSSFWVEPEPRKAAALLSDHIEIRCKELGI